MQIFENSWKSKEEIHVGIVGGGVDEESIWWAEHVHLQQRSGPYTMLLDFETKKPLIDPKPETGLLMELPLKCVVEDVPEDTLSLIKIKITQEQWDAAKAISKGSPPFPFFVFPVFILISLMFYVQGPGLSKQRRPG